MQQIKGCKTLLLAGFLWITAFNSVGHSAEELPSPAEEQVPETGEPKPIYLSLHKAIESTLKNNISIAVRRFDSKIRQQDIDESESEFDPTIGMVLSLDGDSIPSASEFQDSVSSTKHHDWDFSLNQKIVTGAEYELTFNNDRRKTSSQFTALNPQYSSDLEFTISQPLLKNFGLDVNKQKIYIAKNDVTISDYDFNSEVINTVTEMENVYWDLVFSIEGLKVQQKSLERAKDLERRVNAQVEVGILAPLEILQAKAEVASREGLLLTAENLIQDNEDRIRNFLNMNFNVLDFGQRIVPTDTPLFSPIVSIKLKDALRTAFNKRPDMLAKKVSLKNNDIKVKYNKNQLYPSLDLFGSLGLNGISGDNVGNGNSGFAGGYDESLSNLATTDFYNWGIGLKLSYPLGNRSAKSRFTQARLEKAQALLDIKKLERDITVEVREAIRQLKTDIKRVQASRVASKLAKEKLNAEEKKFEVGLSTSFNILQFQEDLAREQSKELKAIIDYNKSQIRLRQVTATTLLAHKVEMDSGDKS